MNLSISPTVEILVLGDVMLDRYWHGSTSRISPEAPVPIVHIKQQQERPGGAGNVALNISRLGVKTTLIAVTGQDEAATSMQTYLNQQGVQCYFAQLPDIPTIIKLRVLSRHQQLIRLDFEEDCARLETPAIQHLMQQQLATTQLVVLSDYGKGTLADCSHLIRAARAADKPVLVDPKGKDFEKYQGATLITPNLVEFEAVVGECHTQAQLVEKGENLRQHLHLDALLITRGEKGMTLLQAQHPPLHLPTHAQEVFDVTGAGDTVISVLAAYLAAGESLADSTRLANLAAGLVVAKLGAATVSVAELEYALHQHQGNQIHHLNSLKAAVQVAQANGEKIVMTNGCFDIIHAGHIQYLTQARQLGDRLIVAVNDDASVKRLKGNARPIHSLEQRMAVLNALQCVDWVIAFSEDTPEALICEILPDILVKGGDYRIEQIAGAKCVQANGGQVFVLDFLAGCSTSRIIEQQDLPTKA
jgi:D-beta-D-heptose 7-phosphate kinase/D-beta-D-heptose 1-phosphate adenosyltransferase